MPANRFCAAAVAASSVPSGANAACASDWSENRRLTLSPSGSAGPAGSLATTSTAGEPSGNEKREQTHVSVRPKLAPNPRSLSSRACPVDGSVSARRTICRGRGLFCLEAPTGECGGIRGAEDRRADRVRPENPGPVGTPQPRRRWARRVIDELSRRVAGRATGQTLTPRSACDRTHRRKEIVNNAGRLRRPSRALDSHRTR